MSTNDIAWEGKRGASSSGSLMILIDMKKLLMLMELTVLSVAVGDDSLHRTMKLRNIK